MFPFAEPITAAPSTSRSLDPAICGSSLYGGAKELLAIQQWFLQHYKAVWFGQRI